MARIIDQLVAEFRPARTEMKHIDVPELGEGVRVYWRPAWTLGEREEVYGGGKSGFALAVDTVLVKACTAEGEEMFKPVDRPDLMHRVRPAIIERISAAMLATVIPETPEALEKN